MKKNLLALALLLCSVTLFSQDYFPKNDGVIQKNTNYTAFTNAKIYVSPTQIIKKGTLLINDGKIVAVGKSVTIPANATTVNLDGKSIYASFIDMYANFGIEKPKRAARSGNPYEASRVGYYWNDHIRTETKATDKFKFDAKKAKELRNIGFGVVNTHNQDGIARGTSALVALNDAKNDAYRILSDKATHHFSFSKAMVSRQAYPTSIMGGLALLKQMHYDAKWYAAGNIKTRDLSLEALNANKNLAQIFEVPDKINALRADKVGDQFGIQYIIVGGGDEYEAINDIKNTNATFIVPIDFPKAYDVSNSFQANYVSLSDMRHWNQAPTNPGVLAKNKISFALTTHKLKKLGDFKSNLSKAIKHGLDKEQALAALTTIPASLLGKSNSLGTLKKGAHANFLISSGDIFDTKTILYENWVQGSKNVVNDMSVTDIRGNYTLTMDSQTYDLSIAGKASKPSITLKKGETKVKAKLTYTNNWLTIVINNPDTNGQFARLQARIANVKSNLSGTATTFNGNTTSWTATKKADDKKEDKKKKEDKDSPTIVDVSYPNMGYGFKKQPKATTILFKNATVWTNEQDGILKNTDVLVKNGKIAKIGKNLSAGGATVVDATGKHLTSGIIDEHTHVGVSGGTNEAGHNSSAEVTVEDVVNPEDYGLYRNLAGGVTTAQILHGSANPIGGRSALIKLKWGRNADDMLYKNAAKFIKFALGENVKQSRNSGRAWRFPQTRMGVEQLYTDYFQRAKEYDVLQKSGKPFRKDLELQTLAEILNKERFITCHSYVQSEINMIMKVAEKFDFRLNTFTHILEGYKVADKMKKHGVGGSTFSDWWAYKYEVNDAIAYNAAIMYNQGITVSINSDDAEMSRRLNQEAGKTVKYGGVPEEEAWKFVTLNPAKLLHIDDKVGSIKIGKDADVVLWSDNPLSIYAKAEKTLIEGIVYFDLENDKKMRTGIKKERNQLINMMLNEKNNGGKTQKPSKKEHKEYHCETVAY